MLQFWNIFTQILILIIKKKSLNEIVIKSNIEAKLYLIESGKGIFDTEIIKLTNPQNQNSFGREFMKFLLQLVNQ